MTSGDTAKRVRSAGCCVFIIAWLGYAALDCGTASPSTDIGDAHDDGSGCFADNDGINGGTYTFDLTVDDTGFSKAILATQNDAQVTLTLHNTGTTPHGFQVECADVALAYPTLVSGCPTTACFSADSLIPPLAPGTSATIAFETPAPDGIIYPFRSSNPDDGVVPGLNDGQWIVN